MGRSATVTYSFQVCWDIDEFRKDFDEPTMTDEEVAAECLESVMADPGAFVGGSDFTCEVVLS